MVVGDLIRNVVRRSPNKAGIIYEDKCYTWSEVNQRVNRFASALASLGLQKGDKVGILAQNSGQYAEVYFALVKTGIIAVPIGWQSAPPEITYILNHSEAKAIVVDSEYLPSIDAIRAELKTVAHVICFGEGHANSLDYETLVAQGVDEEPVAEVFPEDVRILSYTSGTTGKPKGCIVTHGQSIAGLANCLIENPIPRAQPTLLSIPFYTGFGNTRLFLGLYNRSTLVILRRFRPEQVFDAIQKYKVAHMCVVPTMIVAMCNSPEIQNYDLSSLRLIGYGGSVIAPAVLKRAIELFKCDFYQGFGAMEVGGLVAFLSPEDHRLDGTELKEKRLLSTGREAQYAKIRIVGDDGRELPANQPGEMIVKVDSAISGYWKMPEKTAETIRDGWVYTGDVAYRDEDGYIYVVDRKKEMIVSGGMNVYPAEIETALYTHPAVAQAAVIGVPDERWGEAVKAIIELKKGAHATEEEILEFCRERLAAYKKPKSVEFVDSIPVGSSGKVVKRELRERYWQGRERRV